MRSSSSRVVGDDVVESRESGEDGGSGGLFGSYEGSLVARDGFVDSERE